MSQLEDVESEALKSIKRLQNSTLPADKAGIQLSAAAAALDWVKDQRYLELDRELRRAA